MNTVRNETLEDRFYRNVTVGNEYECWPWLGSVNGAGYGQLTYKGMHRIAHRVAYELFFGPITERDVAHRCDNRVCCNPAHLFQATRSTNMKDALAKSRISRLMLKNKQKGDVKRLTRAEIDAGRAERIAAGRPTRHDLSSIRMKQGLRDAMGRRISAGQQLEEPKRDPMGRFLTKQ